MATVVIGVDPAKRSNTIEVIDSDENVLLMARFENSSADYRKMVSVWCADDRKKALTDAKNDRAVPNKTCKTPVDMQYNAGLRMGLEGTPMLLTTDGQFLGGYLPPDVLQQRLEQVEAERGKASGGA